MIIFRGLPAIPALLQQNAGIHDYPDGNPITQLVVSLLF